MGRRKPEKRSIEEVCALAEAFVAGDAARARWSAHASCARVRRTDAGNVTKPVTWSVTLDFVEADGTPVRIDTVTQMVLVDDETGVVRLVET